MEIIKNPARDKWGSLTERSGIDTAKIRGKVSDILADILSRGDAAVSDYVEQFQGVRLDSFAVTESEFDEAEKSLDTSLKEAIKAAGENIAKFHASQKLAVKKVETVPGVVCWQKSVPIEKVGLYVPGGTAPLFSTVLMLAIPARIAGCSKIVICSPCNSEGKVNPATLYAAKIAGVTDFYKLGGVQAIGAMAYGTESVTKVYKIFGPGNQYVMEAKQQVSISGVAIDMPAGPSEVEVLADDSADPEFVASDFLSQSEHGVDSQSILVTTDAALADKVKTAIGEQLKQLPRREIVEKALQNSRIIIFDNMDDAIDFTNEYAPEHLIISCREYGSIGERIINAGSVFLGQYSPESAGDYASGTNHTLPTSGYAKGYNGVNLDSFIRKITFQEISRSGLQQIGETIEIMAANELLDAHKNAVSIRLKNK
ncbi:MAG: histidinol dehydrogenase [Bacteroidetes bacterium]|uniref:Histidinol dehydrogenase n=1 Tax=Candidatus Caccoplasma merdipullorum TaxID=2840718 RepID=A0A9D9E323_9BACT|nr:histidinol dehydrogenase [Candidatus Caccoplasma merdipullorum]